MLEITNYISVRCSVCGDVFDKGLKIEEIPSISMIVDVIIRVPLCEKCVKEYVDRINELEDESVDKSASLRVTRDCITTLRKKLDAARDEIEELTEYKEDRECGAVQTVTPSLDTWKKEFYPVEAKDVSEEDAGAHAALKWSGLTKENLDKHNLTILCGRVYCKEYGYFNIGSDSCVWCSIARLPDGNVSCTSCPAVRAGSLPCDSAWSKWGIYETPIAMIKWVDQAQEAIDQNKVKQTEYEKGYEEGKKDGIKKSVAFEKGKYVGDGCTKKEKKS